MSTLNKFWRIILSYKWGLLIYIVIFGGLAIGMTFLVQDNEIEEFGHLADVPVAIFDRDQTELTAEFITFITDLHDIVEVEDTYDAWLDAVTFNLAALIIEIPAGFTEDFKTANQLQIEFLTNPQNTQGFLLLGQVERYFNMLATYLAGGFDMMEASVLVVQTLDSGVEIEIVTVDDVFAEVYLYYRFLPLALIMVVAIAMGGVFMALNKEDVVRRIESAPVSYRRRTLERIGSCLLFSLVGWAVFMGIAFVMFGADVMLEMENLIRMVNSLPLVFLGIAFAFIVTQFVLKREMLMAIVFPLVFALATPAGIMFDLDMMGEQVLAVARFTPLYWYTRVNNMIIFEATLDWNLVWQSLAIQIAFAAAILAVGMVFSKEKRAKRG